MQPRQNNYFKLAEPAFKHVFALESALKIGPLEPKLLHLVKLRASQINSCVFCIHLHTTEALKDGEDPMRLYLLTGWREATRGHSVKRNRNKCRKHRTVNQGRDPKRADGVHDSVPGANPRACCVSGP